MDFVKAAPSLMSGSEAGPASGGSPTTESIVLCREAIVAFTLKYLLEETGPLKFIFFVD